MNSLALLLSVLILSFILTSIAIVPFIDLLYKLKFLRAQQDTRDAFGVLTPIFNKFHEKKAGVPVGGGLLVIGIVSTLFALLIPLIQKFGIVVTTNYSDVQSEINILFFTFLSFGVLGLYDDIKKFFKFKSSGFFGLRMKHKLILEILLGSIISWMLYNNLGISILHIPFIGTFELGVLYVPFATFTIVAFANAVNITDGLDGLASGTLMISLFGLWFLSSKILDVPLAIFLALLIGSLISFLYFNVFPARLFMGDVGSLAFGATLAVIGLLLGKTIALVVIGFIFVFEIFTSLVQLISKKFFKKKLFPAAPFHLSLQRYGWEEPKIVQRAWLVQIMLTLFGVWLAVL
ncbi:MAG: phospho-N-acetylmuramoyl-pentapeptide-transferase [Patescibacteria group bacterium]|nr:MAG: phospho-N-acetylmuramoyl-pentapeptide-transferase [Patescibacteria group bacterium]